LSVYLADLKNQIGNLRLLLESVEADLSQHAEKREIAETTSTWLATLRERISEIEAETDEAFQARRQLVKLLVAGVKVGRKEDGRPKIEITTGSDRLAKLRAKGIQKRCLWAALRTPCRSHCRRLHIGPQLHSFPTFLFRRSCPEPEDRNLPADGP
jgi:hypothetical protein